MIDIAASGWIGAVEGRKAATKKILALPGDKLYFQVEYRGWKVAK